MNQGAAPGVTVQLVLFHTPADHVVRTIRALARCAEHGWRDGRTSAFTVSIGDCSPAPVLDAARLDALRAELKMPPLREYLARFPDCATAP